jgi:DNA repair photolyase
MEYTFTYNDLLKSLLFWREQDILHSSHKLNKININVSIKRYLGEEINLIEMVLCGFALAC